MSVFVDTNILLRSIQPSHPLHESAVNSVASQLAAGVSLIVTPQIMAEFWNAATRPVENNGLGLPPENAHQELARLESFFRLVSESPEVYAEWKRLVTTYSVIGVKVHDARLVAAMNVYAIQRILTFNPQDFRRYPDIEIITPS